LQKKLSNLSLKVYRLIFFTAITCKLHLQNWAGLFNWSNMQTITSFKLSKEEKKKCAWGYFYHAINWSPVTTYCTLEVNFHYGNDAYWWNIVTWELRIVAAEEIKKWVRSEKREELKSWFKTLNIKES